jgi:hypothetical protein
VKALGVQIAAKAGALIPNLLGEVGGGQRKLAATRGQAGQVGAGALDREAELGLVGALASANQHRGQAVQVVQERPDQRVAAAELGVQERQRPVR